jgi:hypothetical protein
MTQSADQQTRTQAEEAVMAVCRAGTVVLMRRMCVRDGIQCPPPRLMESKGTPTPSCLHFVTM